MITNHIQLFKQKLSLILAFCLTLIALTLTAQNNTPLNNNPGKTIGNDTILSDKDKIQLYFNLSETFNKTPEKALIYDSLGIELSKRNNWNNELILASINYAKHNTTLCNYKKASDALEFIDSIVENNQETKLADLYFQRARIFFDWSRYQLANSYYEKALAKYKLHKDKPGIAKTLKELGITVSVWSDFESSIGYLQQARDIYIELEDKKGLAEVNLAMGVVMEQWGKLDVALKYFENALDYYEEKHIFFNQANLRLHIGDLYLKKGNYNKALDYYFNARNIEKKLPHKKLRSIILSNIGEAYYSLGHYKDAMDYQNRALKLKYEIGDRKRIAISLIDLGKIHLSLKNYKTAIIYGRKAFSIAKPYTFSTQTLESAQLLADGFHSLNQFDSAYYYLNQYIKIKNQIFNEQNIKALNNLQIKYETREKEKENQLLKLEKAQSDLQVTKERNNKYFAILIIIFIVLIAIAIIIFQRFKEQQNRKTTYLLQLKNEEITKQKEELTLLNKELTESRAKYISIVENATIGMYRTTKEGKILFANKTLLNMIGSTWDELKDAELNVFKPSRKELLAIVDKQKIVTGREDKWTNKKGKQIYVNESMWTVNDADGNLLYYEGLVEDITKRKIAENKLKEEEQNLIALNKILKASNDQLEEAKKELEKAYNTKSEFLANISHEIRTPLNAILGFTDLLMGKVKQPDQLQFIQAIRTSGRNMLSLINDILDLSKIQAGKIEMHYEPVSMDDIIDDISKVFSLSIKQKELEFKISKPPSLSKLIYLDDTRMRQILFNLLGNAVKFTDKGGIELFFDVTNETKKYLNLTIQITDTGQGIPDEKQNEIFDAFIQADSGKHTGTGLGLSITKRLVEIMGGTLSLNSKINKGTTFTILLPKIKIFEGSIVSKKKTQNKNNNFDSFQSDNKQIKNINFTKLEIDNIAQSGFNNLFKERSTKLKDGNIITDYISFSEDLITFANKHKFVELKKISMELLEASKSFDVEKINQLFLIINKLFN